MTFHDRSYKNRPKDLSREVGRIHRDLAAMDDKRISRLSSNLHAIPTAPVTTSEGAGLACCCDRVVYVSKDGNGDFDTIQEAINDIAAYETPSATEPWVVYICPGEYVEDVVGADYVSLVGIGTKKDAARIIGVEGPTYKCPNEAHSVENVLFRLAVDIQTVSPILIDAVVVPVDVGGIIFSNCQFEMTTESQPGELVRISGANIAFEDCDFYYDNTAATVGANTHKLFNITGIAVARIISCRIDVELEDDIDSLYIISETANYEIKLMVKDCRVKLLVTNPAAVGGYTFYNAIGDGEEKYVQDNHIGLRMQPVAAFGQIIYIDMLTAKAITVTSNNNVVLVDVDAFLIANIALTNTLNSHHDQFVDLRTGTAALYSNLGTFNYVHSTMPGKEHISQHQDIDLPPGGRFFLNANQIGIASGAFTVIQITGTTWQKGGTFDAVNYRYVPGVLGIYQVNAAVHCVPPAVAFGAEYRVGIGLNGVVVAEGTGHSSFAAQIGPTVSDQIEITNVGDFIDLQLYHSDAINPQIASGLSIDTFISIQKIS